MKSLKLSFILIVSVAITQILPCQNAANFEVTMDSVSGNVYVLYGAGGNIGVCAGEDGILLIDTQFAELADKSKAEIAKVNSGPVKYVFNTNWHYDHVRGNKAFSDEGAVIIAHRLTREHMEKEVRIDTVNGEVPVYSPEYLPVKLIEESMDLVFNEEEIEAKPSSKFDKNNSLFVPADNFVRIVYEDLSGQGA